MKKYFSLLVFTLLFVNGWAQNGTIKGVVQTKQDSLPIWGASVYISGTIYSSFTEEDGTFIIEDVTPGTYNISAEDFTTGDSALVRGIKVKAGETTFVKVGIGVTVKMGEVIEIVYEQPKSESVEGAIAEVKEETKVTTIVSSEEFKSKGDSKVTDAAKRASGVTVEGGKYVYVRGLSDRYSKTLLDGTEIPGLDPNRNAVQLDMFPTSFVQSLKVIKTFSPDLPGDFTGGLVDIRTKDYPEEFELSVTAGVTYNPQVSFQENFLTTKNAGATDWLGYDDGGRAVPTRLNNAIAREDFPGFGEALFDDQEAEKLDQIMSSLNDDMVPVQKQSFTPYNFGFTVGNTFSFQRDSLGIKDPFKVGVVGGVNYRSSLDHYEDGDANVYDLTGNLIGKSELDPLRVMKQSQSNQSVLIGALAKIGLEFNKDHKLVLSYLKNQSGQLTASTAEGENIDDDFFYRSRSMQYLERSMDNFILSGDHTLGGDKFKLIVDWAGAYTRSSQETPDLRFFNDNLDADGNPEFRFQNYVGPVRFWREMNEDNLDGKLNFTIPIELKNERTLKIKAGGSYVNKDRLFTEKRVDYKLGPEATYNGNPIDFLSSDNIGWLGDPTDFVNDYGVYVENQTNVKNNYEGLSQIGAGYALADLPLGQRFTASLGARAEHTNIQVNSQLVGEDTASVVQWNILPSVNLSYNLIDGKKVKSKRDTTVEQTRDLKLRLSYNQTLARPNFRELAPFAVEDFVNNSLVVGNPDLVMTEVKNYDFRLEFYPNSGEQLSVAAFYKDFTNPIEQITSPTAANIEFTWVNNTKARLYGIELELRKNLGFLTQALNNFEISGNLSLVESSADVNEEELELIRATDPDHLATRPMFGQSPYILNGTFGYKNDSIGLNVNLALNMFGDRLVLVTKGGLPDIYELGRTTLDLNIAQNFGDRWKITLRARNLLNPEFKQVYKVETKSDRYLISPDNEEFIFANYKKGRQFSISVSYKF